MRRREGPSVALGAAALVAIAAMVVAGKLMWERLPSRTRTDVQACCKSPIEVIDSDGQRLGCVSDPDVALCGRLSSGDRVRLVEHSCTVESRGMSAGMRVLSGLKIDVNRATVDDLMHIDGVSDTLARRIIDERSQRGRFDSVDALNTVPGVGPSTLSILREHLAAN